MNKRNLVIAVISILIMITPIARAVVINEVDSSLKDELGHDFFAKYVKEPIINQVSDPEWESYDKERAKELLQIETLPIVKNIIIYPVEIDGIESSFRVIVFEDNSFYSELTQPVEINIDRNKASELAKERGIKEPFNIVLTTNDNFFGWQFISAKNPNQIKEDEVTQVSINIKTGSANPTIFNPIRYDEDEKVDNKTIIWFVLLLISIGLIFQFVKKRGKNEKN